MIHALGFEYEKDDSEDDSEEKNRVMRMLVKSEVRIGMERPSL